jgi:hypothetical protein
MKTLCRRLSALFVLLIAGCGSPTPAPMANGPPPLPPVMPAVVQKPIPPPAEKPKPDPFETAMTEVSANLKRYPTLFAGVKDEATADKAVAEVGRLTSRLKELAAEISKLPVKPGQEKYVIALHNDLAQLPTALQANPNMQQVLGDPEIGLKINVAHLTFINEAVQPLAGALMARQAPSAAAPVEPPPPQTSGSPQP